MHYHIAPEPDNKSYRRHKLIGLFCLLLFLVLVGKIWVPYAKAAINATAITFLPPAWAKSYIEATLPDTAKTKSENRLIIGTNDLAIEAPIIDGIGPTALLQGVGHDPASSKPGEQGRVVISGHRFWPDASPWATVFFSLDKLKKGDKISLVYDGQTYVYTVFEQWDVPKEKAYPHLEPSTESILTIYTCGPTPYTARNRLGFHARLDQSTLRQTSLETLQTLQKGVLEQ